MLTSLDHVIVAVSDLDRAARSMGIVLGRSPSWRGSHPAFGTANALFRLDNSYLELLAPVGPGALADIVRARVDTGGEGLVGMAFGTPDADACAMALRSRALPASEPQPGLGRDEESGAYRTWRSVRLPREATRGVWMFAIEHMAPPELLPPAPAVAANRAVAFALDHVVVASSDLAASAALFGDALGLRLALDRSFPTRGVRLLFFRVGGVTVEVAGALDPDAAAHTDRSAAPRDADAALVRAPDRATDRLAGLAWRVPDADAARARLVAAGVDVSEVRPGAKPGTRVCTVRRGTCGVPTLLLEPAATPPPTGPEHVR